jgi:hypothetical protein
MAETLAYAAAMFVVAPLPIGTHQKW